MSYILDALRKADAQRQRDPARGIHAQPLGSSASGPQPGSGRGVRLWSAAAVAVVALSSGAWYLYRDQVPDVSGRHTGGAVRTPASLTTLAQAQTAPLAGSNGVPPTAPASVPAPAPRAAAAPAPGVAPAPAINPAPVINPPPAPAQTFTPSGDPRATSQPTMRNAPPPTVQTTPRTARMAPPRVPAVSAPVAASTLSPPVAGLPPDAPKLVLGGGVYSANRAQRMLIVNGQVFNEGSEVAPGVTLEEMKPRTVVLRFHGARYTVAY
jgi:general secretion pathway protein B